MRSSALRASFTRLSTTLSPSSTLVVVGSIRRGPLAGPKKEADWRVSTLLVFSPKWSTADNKTAARPRPPRPPPTLDRRRRWSPLVQLPPPLPPACTSASLAAQATTQTQPSSRPSPPMATPVKSSSLYPHPPPPLFTRSHQANMSPLDGILATSLTRPHRSPSRLPAKTATHTQ